MRQVGRHVLRHISFWHFPLYVIHIVFYANAAFAQTAPLRFSVFLNNYLLEMQNTESGQRVRRLFDRNEYAKHLDEQSRQLLQRSFEEFASRRGLSGLPPNTAKWLLLLSKQLFEGRGDLQVPFSSNVLELLRQMPNAFLLRHSHFFFVDAIMAMGTGQGFFRFESPRRGACAYLLLRPRSIR